MTAPSTPTLAITVLMSCYNATRWLEEAISSVLNQTFKEFEFIIIDDGSTDDTLKIIQQFAARDHRIIIIAKPNTGLADSLNVGLARARGEWIARLDADDICAPNRLKQQYEYARAHQKVVFIGSGLTEIDQYGHTVKIHHYPPQHAFLLKRLQTLQPFPAHSSAFYQATAARTLKGYRPRITRAEDLDLWLRLAEIGELACLSEPLISLRKHANQISHDNAGKQQLICAYLAITSHFIRQFQSIDPLDTDEIQFDVFKAWIETQIDVNKVFTLAAYRVAFKKLLAESPHSVAVFCNIICAIIYKPNDMLKLFWQKITGDNLPRILAKSWILK